MMRAPEHVRRAAREALAAAEDPTPAAIAPKVVEGLSRSDAKLLLLVAAEALLSQELHTLRTYVPTEEAETRVEGTSRWVRARLRLDGLGISICVAGAHKWVEDCTAGDLSVYASEQRKRAGALTDNAKQVEAYARALQRSGAANLGDWDRMGRPDGLAVAA